MAEEDFFEAAELLKGARLAFSDTEFDRAVRHLLDDRIPLTPANCALQERFGRCLQRDEE